MTQTVDPTAGAKPVALSKQDQAKAAKVQAEAKVEAARRLLAEAEAELKANWKSGSKETLRFDIKRPQFGAGPKVNGKRLIGVCDLTYDEFQGLMSSLSNRAEQEAIQRFGYHEGERYIRLEGGNGKQVSMVY